MANLNTGHALLRAWKTRRNLTNTQIAKLLSAEGLADLHRSTVGRWLDDDSPMTPNTDAQVGLWRVARIPQSAWASSSMDRSMKARERTRNTAQRR